MTPFSETQTQLKPSLWARISARRIPLIFALCLLAGLTAVAWRAKARLEFTRAVAQTEARACGASLELQFIQVPGAMDALGTLARPGGGGSANSPRLQEVLRRAQLDQLPRQGYDFALFIPSQAQQKPVAIASRGLSSLQDTFQYPVRVKILELRLALKPRAGWINKTKLGLESLAVLLASVMVPLLVNLLDSRRAMEAELKGTAQRLAREVTDRAQAQADCNAEKEKAAGAKTELRQAQAALQQAESKATQAQAAMAELQVRLDTVTNTARDSAETSVARVARLERSNRELREQLLRAEQAQSRVMELSALLEKAEEKLGQRQKASSQNLTTVSADSEEATVPEASGDDPWVDAPVEAPEEVNASPAPSAVESDSAESSGANPDEDSRSDSTESPASEGVASLAIDEANSGSPSRSDAPMVGATSVPESPLTHRPIRVARRKQTRRDDQLALFGNEVVADPPARQRVAAVEAPPASTSETDEEDKPAASRRLPAAPPVDPVQLRKAVNLILPLLAERDPGAKDCLKDNRSTFRSTFTPEAYVEFEQQVKSGEFDPALEQLRKAVKKHGISV